MAQGNYLNVGCGTRFHREWTNIDLTSSAPEVIAHDILNGLPFRDGEFDAVYHSHVLEHLTKEKAPELIRECHRVLKPGGVLRVVVPDLEGIVREYLRQLERAMAGEPMAEENYDWMMIELFDQVIRERCGGEMMSYLGRPDLPNEEFVYGRLGWVARFTRELALKGNRPTNGTAPQQRSAAQKLRSQARRFVSPKRWRTRLERWIVGDDRDALAVGRFRREGEVHLWMYDRYSLGRLLERCGFTDVRVMSAVESRVPEWTRFELDATSDGVLKPDSLFMEGIKK